MESEMGLSNGFILLEQRRPNAQEYPMVPITHHRQARVLIRLTMLVRKSLGFIPPVHCAKNYVARVWKSVKECSILGETMGYVCWVRCCGAICFILLTSIQSHTYFPPSQTKDCNRRTSHSQNTSVNREGTPDHAQDITRVRHL